MTNVLISKITLSRANYIRGTIISIQHRDGNLAALLGHFTRDASSPVFSFPDPPCTLAPPAFVAIIITALLFMI